MNEGSIAAVLQMATSISEHDVVHQTIMLISAWK